ncbi:hypothetical protein CRUP_002974, partial [Coryphaenoides rupestris]
MWYSTVVDKRYSPGAAARLASLNGDTVAAGLVSCLVVYPLYLLLFAIFRTSRSQCVSVEQIPAQVDQESVEIDDFLDNSIGGSSFLLFNGVHDGTNSEETNVDLPTPSNKSVDSWTLAEQEETDDRDDWPEMVSDVSVIGGGGLGAGLPRLKRGQGSRHLGVDMTFNPDDEQGNGQRNKNFTSSVVTDVCRPRRLPPWCGRAALWGSWVVCEACYYAVWVRRLRAEDQDVLVDFPRVERVVQRVSRVRPPQGFALSQARHQARKVHMLHTMLKNFLVYMFFLLVVLLLNYSDTAKDTHSLRLRTQLERTLHTPAYHNISRDTGAVLLGTLRLRQLTDSHDAAGIGYTGRGQGRGSGALRNAHYSPPGISPHDAHMAWSSQGQTGAPGGEVLVYQLNRSLEQASASLHNLQQGHWLSH